MKRNIVSPERYGDIEFWWKGLTPKHFTTFYFANKAN